MTQISAQMIRDLRERTQAGMSDCKNALVEAEGDLDKAVEIILKKGIVKAAKRAGRVAAEGEVRTAIDNGGKRGTIVEVNCQTDFVARGEEFGGFVGKVLDVARKLADGTDLLAQKVEGEKSLDTLRQEFIAKCGENTVVRRWGMLETKAPGGIVREYIHMGGKLAVLIQAEAPSADAAKNADVLAFLDNCAMQIAAMNPLVVSKEQVPQADIAKQKEIFEAQLKEEGKPEKAWPKIIEGKLNKWYTEVTLLGQAQVWDAEKGGSVDAVRAELAKQIGGDLQIVTFLRYGLGEGIEKQSDDLAAEVAKMAGN